MIELSTDKSPLRVAAYARISTIEEVKEEGSYENQKRFFENEITSHNGWSLAKVYGDYAKSGMEIVGRFEFQQMMADALDHQFDYIITKSISRFARNAGDCVDCIRKLQSAGVNVYFMEQNLDTGSEFSELVLTVLASIAQMESESIRDNIMMTTTKFNAMGKPTRPARYGYTKKNKSNDWIVVPSEAKRIKIIYLFTAHGIHRSVTVKYLNEMELTEGTGFTWSKGKVVNVISSEVYYGDIYTNKTCIVKAKDGAVKVVNNDGIVDRYYIDHHHEALVSRELAELLCRLQSEFMLFGQKNYNEAELLKARKIADSDPLLDEVRVHLIGVE